MSPNNLGPFKSMSDQSYSEYAGFLEGVLTGYNRYGKNPIFSTYIGSDSTSLRFLYNYCSSHLYNYLMDAVDALILELGRHSEM